MLSTAGAALLSQLRDELSVDHAGALAPLAAWFSSAFDCAADAENCEDAEVWPPDSHGTRRQGFQGFRGAGFQRMGCGLGAHPINNCQIGTKCPILY
jgi:hypothetical protein